MQADCQARLQTYLDNDFLVISSLLDPRYTVQTEELVDSKFKHYVEDMVTVFSKFRGGGPTSNENAAELEPNAPSNLSGTKMSNDFWARFSQPSPSNNKTSSKSSSQKVFKESLEVVPKLLF